MVDQVLSGKKILIVDDEEKNIQLIGSILRSFEKTIKIVVSTNGEDAIEKTHLLKPDLILMDINMPILNGVEACRRC